MRRPLKILLWVVALLVGVPVLVAGLALLALNVDAGRNLTGRLVAWQTGGMVKLDGISGRFPDALRVASIDIRDDKGVWLSVRDAALDWSPLRLLSRQAEVRRLSAARVVVARLPDSSGGGSSGSFQLPVRVDLEALHIDRLELGAALAGTPAVLSADGSAHLATLQQGAADLTLARVEGGGRYHLNGRLDPAGIDATLQADEPAQGLISALAGLPGLGALSVKASMAGPRNAAATQVAMTAGALQAAAHGRVDIDGQAADLDVTASAPAMAPRPDLSWQSVALDAHVEGPFTRPQAHGTARIEGLAAGGATVRLLTAQLAGNEGRVSLTARAEGIGVPGPRPDLLAADPVTLKADARLDQPDRPVSFSVSHKLLTLAGTAQTGGALAASAHLDLPDLAPLAAVGGVDLAGSIALDLKATTTTLEADGILAVTGGPAPLPGLIGPAAKLGLGVALHGQDVTLSRLAVNGQAVRLAAHGGMAGGAITLDWQAGLPDLSVLAATVQGRVQGSGHVQGATDDFAVNAELTGDVATQGVPSGPVRLSLSAQGLPSRPSGTIKAEGTLDAAPLALDARVQRAPDGAVDFAIERADWKSAHAEGALAVAAGADWPAGKLAFRVERLDDAQRLIGQAVSGALNGTAEFGQDNGRKRGHAQVTASNAGLPGTATIGQATLDATVLDPTADAQVDGRLDFSGLNASGIGGSGRVQLRGGQAALALQVQTALQNVGGETLQATGAATLDVPGRKVAISALQATWKNETLRLLAPARVGFGDGVTVDRARLGLRNAVLEVAGRVTPTLALTASVRNLGPDVARIFVPGLQAEGNIQADATLSGTPQRPTGTVRLAGSGLRLRSGAGAAMPAAAVTANLTLAGATAQVQARVTAARNEITLDGTLPIDPAGAVNLRARGGVDIAVLNRLIAGQGRRVRGQLTLDAAITGTLAAPLADGTLTLAGGDLEDFGLGVHVSAIEAVLRAAGDTIQLARLSGKAGAGTISGSGSIGLAGTRPVDLRITSSNATPLTSDRLTATLDMNVTVRGDLGGELTIGGTTTINHAEVRVPDRMPAAIVVLDVRRPGAPPPRAAGSGTAIALDLTVTAPGRVFVRGRGVFAELQGNIHVGGTTAAPLPAGSFTLRQGSFTMLGRTLTFTSGEIGFDGSGKLDPSLHLVATSSNGATTATLTVTGYASAPKIALSSVPELPPDEVLAQLLFQQSAANLSVFQLAEAAAALSQFSGVVSSKFDPLNSIRSGLGLDRLSVGGTTGGSGATFEAGRYVAPGVFVGAKQGTSGSGTQATVQVDLMKGLKLETTVGTGGATSATGSTATADPSGTSVGLTYHFDY